MTKLSQEFEEWGRQKGILKGHDLIPLYGRHQFDDGHWRAFCAEKGIDPRNPWGIEDHGRIKAMQWQDISTAPKDGTMFLAWSDERGYIVCNQPPNCAIGLWHLRGSGWCGGADNRAQVATHWAPLLPLPSEKGNK